VQQIWYLAIALAGIAAAVRWVVLWARHQMIGPFWTIEWTPERRRLLLRSVVEMAVAFAALVVALKVEW
jgi:hypothetical protein